MSAPAYNRQNEEVLKTLVFNTFVFTQIFNSINCRRLDRNLNVFKGILLNWYFMIITLIDACLVGIQILIVFIGGPAFQVVEITGRDWAISIIVGLGAMVVGAIMRLIPNGIFEVAFVKLKLIRDPNELPTVNWNPALDKVRENLTIFQNIRGGRLQGSSFVMKSRSAQLEQNNIQLYVPSLEATLWEGRVQFHSGRTRLWPSGHRSDDERRAL
ncbi:hypothetical protein EXIGLDRAFT_700991 [Exidia glandulosa HHB12029]|uniref:Cation-transporting P-type ATPase C-terminal domain-containing protein n=1 Tax=Exidia glandulosa HHB12029 TaxID=1314781 RepID=A0A165LXQ7_EXIGL|nr:hypothetical protein EXIGLDRAFT_700991 [Exidia glandulosa HHB12029]